ncbi:MAG TPA: hypothetical protein VK992_02640 [Candidatus Caenarcaniphilales bacterium]|nr:hypothetical protein [Candidatus Caenarcaniphilales bacterium]
MSETPPARSAEACPVCGAHQLTLLRFPRVDVRGVRPYDEIIGMGDPTADDPPGIGCLACGSEWTDLETFRQEQARGRGQLG